MAAVMNVLKRSLNVSISRGQDADGNPVSKTYTYSNVKPEKCWRQARPWAACSITKLPAL